MEDPVYIGFSREATEWFERLRVEHRQVVERRLRELARDPERAPIRLKTPKGRTIYIALAVLDDDLVWAHRIDFMVDEAMSSRGNLPAIAVLRGKPLAHRRLAL